MNKTINDMVREVVEGASERELVCPWCLDNSKSCKACDDSYEGE